MIPISIQFLSLLALLALLGDPASAERQSRLLAEQLRLMSVEQGFVIKGLHRLEPIDAPSGGDGPAAVRRLLKDYDHVMELDGDQAIRRLIIIGKKRPAPPPAPPPPQQDEITLTTKRQGEHHLVKATLFGHDGRQLDTNLMVDTGASLVVLPTSTADKLGLRPAEMDERSLQTVKGKMSARVGPIRQIALGQARIADVEVALVDDESLGTTGLLGMNVLSRYLFILDDENSQLILIPQENQ